MKIKKHTKTFNAYSDDDKRFIIYEYTEFENAGSFDNPNAMLEGLKELKTSDGNAVNRIEKGRYQIITPFGEIIVTLDSSDAP